MAAFSEHDRATIETILDEACSWYVPGENAVGGTYAGRAAVMALFRQLRRTFDGPATFELIAVTAHGDLVVAHQRASISVGGQPHCLEEHLVFRFRGDQVVDVVEFQHDQVAFDQTFARRADGLALLG